MLSCGWSGPEGFISIYLLRAHGDVSRDRRLNLRHLVTKIARICRLLSKNARAGLVWCSRMVCLSLDQCPGASCMQVTMDGTVYMQLQARP